jgi:hypothetical protein
MCLHDSISFGKDHDNNEDDIHSPLLTRSSADEPRTSRYMPTVVILGGAMLTSATVTMFSLYFPFWLAPEAATKTYHLAFYQYHNPELHHFDTTAWTYGTDYGLAVVMIFYCWTLYRQKKTQSLSPASCCNNKSGTLCQHIWGLLLGYAASTMAGGLAHQNYTLREQRNSWHFRLLWTICVGTVTFASTPMGSIATEIATQVQPHTTLVTLPQIPHLFWKVHGVVTTIVCAFGWFSYQRPACDIFIAGITQFPSSFYLSMTLFQITQDPALSAFFFRRPRTTLWMGIFAFIANAPLLPLYLLLVQYTNWSLAQVNTFLHAWLLVTWSLQAISLHGVQEAMAAMHQKSPGKTVAMVTHDVSLAQHSDKKDS